jgi:hypothetical protein
MSFEQRVRESLRRPLEGEQDAELRAWQVVSAAAARPEARPPQQPFLARWRPLTALATVAALTAVALTPPGEAVSDWLRDGLGIREQSRPGARSSLSLPAGGQLLVNAPRGTWVVRRDGSRRRIGSYSDASWSPNGLFVSAVTGRQVVALTPDGEVRWALSGTEAASRPRWAPSGLRIAYLSGPNLRVVSGAGTDDGEVDRAVAPVAPAWRPQGQDELAYVDGRGAIVLASAVTGRTLWRSAPGSRPLALEWSRDGARLAAIARSGVRVLNRQGQVRSLFDPPAGADFGVADFSPRGHRLALVERRPGESGVVLVSTGDRAARRKPIFASAAPLEDIAWSPNGRWVMATSPRADQWLFLRERAPNDVIARSGIARQFDPGHRIAAFPRLSGWCCTP